MTGACPGCYCVPHRIRKQGLGLEKMDNSKTFTILSCTVLAVSNTFALLSVLISININAKIIYRTVENFCAQPVMPPRGSGHDTFKQLCEDFCLLTVMAIRNTTHYAKVCQHSDCTSWQLLAEGPQTVTFYYCHNQQPGKKKQASKVTRLQRDTKRLIKKKEAEL